MSNETPTAPPFAADEAEIERNAYNAAFYALGFRWHWDIDTYHALQAMAEGPQRVRVYLEKQQAHLLTAYDADFLVNAIEKKKTECRNTMTPTSSGAPYFDWAQARTADLGA